MQDISQLKEQITALYEKHRNVNEGSVATYIPELGKANPDWFGISLMMVDGQEFSIGDWSQEFTIQSICKPFAFLMALEKHGREHTLGYVGVEPSGDSFNSIQLDPKTARPFNPMVNAGAIAVSSLIKGDHRDQGTTEFVDRLSRAAGRPLRIDRRWCVPPKSATGNRNRAIAWLMRNFDIIDEHVDDTLHQYFSQCSVLVNCRDLAAMGATLANMGE